MRRLRWYLLDESNVDTSPTAIARLLRRFSYSTKSNSGVVLETSTEDETAGRFVERREMIETASDPLGNTFEFRRVQFVSFGFRFVSSAPQLEIIDAPRTMAPFVSMLSEASDYRLAVDLFRPELTALLSSVRRNVRASTIELLEYSNVAMSEAASADILIKGTSNVQDVADSLLGHRQRQLSRARVVWSNHIGERVRCELTSNGARFDESDEDSVYPVVRKTIESLVAQRARARPLGAV